MKRMMLILWAVAASVEAEGTAAPVEDWGALKIQAVELHDKARQMRAEAARHQTETEAACMDKFLYASCLQDAGKARQTEDREAKRIEHEARAIERKIKLHDLEVKEARRLEEAPRQEAEAAQRAEKNRREREEAMLRVERKQAGKQATPGK